MEEYDNSKWKTVLWIALYSIVIGTLLSVFVQIESMIRYVFSLLALYLIVRFFKRFETWGPRIAFIVCSLVVFFLAAIIFVAYTLMQEYPQGLPAS